MASPPILSPPHPHRVSDASGSLEVTPVAKYPLKNEMLDTKVGEALPHSEVIQQ